MILVLLPLTNNKRYTFRRWHSEFEVFRSPVLSSYLLFYFIVWRDSFLSSLKSTAFECLNKTAWSFPGDETLSLFLLPLVSNNSPLGRLFFISVIHVLFCLFFMNPVVFSPPSSITLCFKAIWILLSNSVLFVLKPPLLQPSFFCHLSSPHKLCFCCICQLWLHFITLFNYLTSIFYCSAN